VICEATFHSVRYELGVLVQVWLSQIMLGLSEDQFVVTTCTNIGFSYVKRAVPFVLGVSLSILSNNQ